jgi:hypothetical protein
MAIRKSRFRFSSLRIGDEGWVRMLGTKSFAPIRKTSWDGGIFMGDPKGVPSGTLRGKRFAAIRNPIVIRKSKGKGR